ncbi:MAG: 3-ketoacyl-ACP reductase [Ruminococcaceae bacterium]|nr:3-ketoacyl-ACP reductase [Oscillospiraceae bacterium]
MNTTPVAIITGSSRGIGFSVAEFLHSMGYHVIVNSSSYRQETESAFKTAFGDNHTYVWGDIKQRDTHRALVDAAKKLGRLDLLVNNAGIAPPVREDILVSKEENFDIVIETNLKAVFFMTQICANYMIEAKKNCGDCTPRIINVGSMSAYVSSTNRGEYCISKAGVSMVTALFADRLAEFDIPVFEIRPGIIKTDMTSAVTEKYDKLIASGAASATKRWGDPSDIAKIVKAISEGAFDFSTGQIFNADGGFHLRRL